MKSLINTTIAMAGGALLLASTTLGALASDLPNPLPLEEGAQATMDTIKAAPDGKYRIAYMPPATEFNYYLAIGEGIKSVAKEAGVEVFMLAPQSGADINGQMGMLQDVLTQKVDAVIFSTHDEFAAAPLVKRAVEQGIAVVMVNSDIPKFPTPIHAVVGYSQRNATRKLAEQVLPTVKDMDIKLGVLEGQPGWHSTERVGGFVDGVKEASNVEVVATVNGKWNVEGGNTAAMDILQSHPEVNMLFAANDYEAIGASYATKALGRKDVMILGNDGDTTGLEEIFAGNITASVNTRPFYMGKVAMNVTLEALKGTAKGGWYEIPTEVVTKDNVLTILQTPAELYPAPSKKY
ncbi:sugar ABC transporter substrate-binding protein [uncultured Cohaesibacter sp.]|uniref:sugar ABC transporter substrate-binding protein n=1 Tax=uncultured Cohaesibacter sp. TaxID=1002546 RepID=UPI0029C66E60|nr:sugar ABC transporter substrate-binding protein [uncultured Cohaesibacter sp.]